MIIPDPIRLLTSFFVMVLAQACGTHHILSKIEDPKQDVLRNETFLRYNVSRLEDFLARTPTYRGILLCHHGNVSSGKLALRNELKEKKDDAEYWIHVGNCYFLEGNLPKAEFFYQLALETALSGGRKLPVAYNNLGVVALRAGHYERAQQFFGQAIEQDKSLLTPRFNQAQLHVQFGLLETAEQEIRALLALAPLDVDLLASEAAILTLKGEVKAALTIYQKIDHARLARQDIAAYLALALYLDGQFEAARMALSRQHGVVVPTIKRMSKRLAKLIDTELERLKRPHS